MERIKHIRNVLNNHPVRIIEPGGRAHAAVALILEEQPSGLSILLIERSTNTNDYWSGQIGLPGGRSETIDKRPQHTAERETSEEIGLDLSTTQFLGRLDDIAPGGLKIVISCFVYAVNDHPILRPDRSEIADAFWVPAFELKNPARISSVEFMFRNRLRIFPALRVVDDKEQQESIKPSYEQKVFTDEEKRNTLRLIASPDGRNGSVTIHQDVNLYAILLESGKSVVHDLQEKRHAWLQVAHGSVQVNHQLLEAGDGAAVSDENQLVITGKENAEVLLFDLA